MSVYKIKIVYNMLRKYGRKSVFSKSFAIIFASFFIVFAVAFFIIQFWACSTEDGQVIEDYTRDLYLSRNRLESILTSDNDITASLLNNPDIIDFINNGNIGNLEEITEILEIEKYNSGFLNSIYIYLPESEWIASSSAIYKSGRLKDFVDISWLDFYEKGRNFFYREYPDSGVVLKCISHCSSVVTESGAKAVFVYNVNYSKASIDYSVYDKDTLLFMFDDKKSILYCSDERLIGDKVDEHVDKSFKYDDITPYISRWDSYDEIVLSVGMRRSDVKLILVLDKAWKSSAWLAPIPVIVWMLICFAAALFISLMITVWIYRPLTDIFRLVNAEDKHKLGKDNEINDAIEYIVNITKNKQIAENELTQNTILLQHAQIVALQLQLNPHFLFNTLQLLNSVILNEFKRDTEATKIVSIISQLLRDALDTTEFFKTLEEEAMFAKQYIEIQNIRYPGCFEVEWDIADDTKRHRVPKCILQPLLENSIAYGILPLNNDEGKIRVKSYIKGNILKISVWDNGVGFKKAKLEEVRHMLMDKKIERKNNIGLFNVNQRIKILFGAEYGIEIMTENGTEVVISLPAE